MRVCMVVGAPMCGRWACSAWWMGWRPVTPSPSGSSGAGREVRMPASGPGMMAVARWSSDRTPLGRRWRQALPRPPPRCCQQRTWVAHLRYALELRAA